MRISPATWCGGGMNWERSGNLRRQLFHGFKYQQTRVYIRALFFLVDYVTASRSLRSGDSPHVKAASYTRIARGLFRVSTGGSGRGQLRIGIDGDSKRVGAGASLR